MTFAPQHSGVPNSGGSTDLTAVSRTDAFRSTQEAIVLDVVSGTTCSGKSTYLKDAEGRYDSILFAHSFVVKKLKPGQHALHYNILRPISNNFDSIWLKVLRHAQTLISSRKSVIERFGLYERDPVWRALLRGSVSIHVTVLVVPQRILLERAGQRSFNEPLFSRRRNSYDKEKWTRILAAVNIVDLYRQWLAFLESHQIPYHLVDSCDSRYLTIPGKSALFDLLRGEHTID